MPQKQVIIVATEGDPSPSGLTPLAATLTTLVAVGTLILVGWAGIKLFQWVWPTLENILLFAALALYTTLLGIKRRKFTEEEKKTPLFDQMVMSAEAKRTPEEDPLDEETKSGAKIVTLIVILAMALGVLFLDFTLTYLLSAHATNPVYQIHPAVNVLGLAATATAAWWSFAGIRSLYGVMRLLDKPSEEQKLLHFLVNKLLILVVASDIVVIFLVKFGIL